MDRGLPQVAALGAEILVETVIERELHPPPHEGTGGDEHDEHRQGEAGDQARLEREASHASSRRKPMPRTVWIELRPNGLSTLARSRPMWTSIALLRRSVSSSHAVSRMRRRVTTRPARSASVTSRSNSRAV